MYDPFEERNDLLIASRPETDEFETDERLPTDADLDASLDAFDAFACSLDDGDDYPDYDEEAAALLDRLARLSDE